MALKIRMTRGGAKKRPFYSIVVTEHTSPRDGRFIEKLGTYNPMVGREHPDRVRLNDERIKYWVSVGALPSDRVARFMADAGLGERPKFNETPKKSAPKAKAQERLKVAADAAAAAAEAAAEPKAE